MKLSPFRMWKSQGVELPEAGTPRRWNSQRSGTPRGVELSEEWNSRGVESQKGETLKGVELPAEGNSQQSEIQVAGHFLKFENSQQSEIRFAGHFRELEQAKIHTQILIKSGTPRRVELPEEWNSQARGTPSGGELPAE